MRKSFLLVLLMVVAILVITGCSKSENSEISNKNENTDVINDNTNTSNDEPQLPSDSLPISEIEGLYNEDLPLGLETNFVKVNGNEVVIRVQTTGSSDQQANGPYYIFYNVYVGNDTLGLKCVRDAIYHLEGFGIEMLKTFDEEEDIGVNYEFFEWDFTSSTHKGVDKEYVAISLPAGIEDKNQASLLITTDDGKLLGEFIADVVHDTDLTGPDVEKYKNHSEDIVFNSIKDGNITYLTPTPAMYKTDSNGNKDLDTSLSEIELEEHSVTMNNNKAEDTKTDNIYRITNASGKSFNFGEFRHL